MNHPVVLIIEDSRTCSSHLAARLRAEPYRAHVITQPTIQAARTWLSEHVGHKPSLVVLDVQLPDGNGFDLLPLLEDVPVVVVSDSLVELPVRKGGLVFVRKGRGWATQVESILERICNA